METSKKTQYSEYILEVVWEIFCFLFEEKESHLRLGFQTDFQKIFFFWIS